MRLVLLTALVMVAFAANSVLNRAALLNGQIDPLSFAWIRTASGGLALLALVLLRGQLRRGGGALPGPLMALGALSLATYMICFSVAYVSIDTGLGALILFGGAQVTMFAGALWAREALPPARWAGAGLALAGLVWLLWPNEAFDLSLLHAVLMLTAAIGWGIYSLVGRRAAEPLRASAANFLLAAPICIALALAAPVQLDGVLPSWPGVGLAVLSGVVTSALAYALWYSVLPQLSASTAGLAMVSVPVIALLGGVAFLGEAVTLRLVLASAVVLGGVALGVLAPQRRAP